MHVRMVWIDLFISIAASMYILEIEVLRAYFYICWICYATRQAALVVGLNRYSYVFFDSD